jgi:putative peptide maturation system protein
MSDQLRFVVTEALNALLGIHDASDKRTAETALRSLARCTDLPIRLLEQPMNGGQNAYDVVIPVPGHGTFSLCFSPAQGIPWMLLGAQSWRERDFLRVGTEFLQVKDVVAYLDFIWREKDILRKLIELGIVRHELKRRGIGLTPDEVQDALDALRRSLGLYTIESTEAWMSARGLDAGRLESYAIDHGLVSKLRREVVSSDAIDSFCREHSDALDELTLLSLDYDTQAQAEDALATSRGDSLGAILERAALASGPGSARSLNLRRARRIELTGEMKSARPGHAVVLPDRDKWKVVRMISCKPRPNVDDADRELVLSHLFAEWVEAQRGSIDTQWFWGTTNDTTF